MRRPVAASVAHVVALLALVGLYCVSVLPHIADNPVVGGDEGWIVSASAKLAQEGVFGSDLFSGFYGAEKHYYFNLPLHHLVLAGVFKVFGVGLVQARLVSFVAGLLTLLLTYGLGRRLGGKWVGLGAAALIVLLRLNLTPFTGLTLTDLGAIVRYDLVALPYGLGAVYLLAREKGPPRPRTVALVGLLLGMACLTQFIGAFFILPIFLFILTTSHLPAMRIVLVFVAGAAMVIPFLPYLGFIAVDWKDFRGQARAVEQETDFFSGSFYSDNFNNEDDRYALGTELHGLPTSLSDLTHRPSARLAIYVLGPIALALAFIRGRSDPGRRLLALVLLFLPLEFALFESTKRFVYWVIVVPFLCVAIADLGAALLRWRPSTRALQYAAAGATAVVALVFAVEGIGVAARGIRDAPDAADYAGIGHGLSEMIGPNARVVSDNRLWLTLKDAEPRSLLLLFYFTNPRISKTRTTDVPGAMAKIDADYLLLSPLTKEILTKLTPEDHAAFDAYMAEKASLVGTLPYPTYGPIEVYKLAK